MLCMVLNRLVLIDEGRHPHSPRYQAPPWGQARAGLGCGSVGGPGWAGPTAELVRAVGSRTPALLGQCLWSQGTEMGVRAMGWVGEALEGGQGQ